MAECTGHSAGRRARQETRRRLAGIAPARPVLAAGLLFLSACASPPPPNPAALELLISDATNIAFPAREAWSVRGLSSRDGAPRMALVQQSGVPAVRVTPGDTPLVVTRRLSARLLAAPFLSWSWNVRVDGEATPADDPGLIILAGFADGAGAATDAPRNDGWLAPVLPAFDRLLLATWAPSALRRGTLSPAAGFGPDVAHYAARGGRENTDTWWVETVDLLTLFRQSWPAVTADEARIVFLGLAVAPESALADADIAGISLSR